MSKINIYDRVRLTDGKIAHVYEIYSESQEYDVSIQVDEQDIDMVFKTIKQSDIAQVLERPYYTNEQKRALAAGCIVACFNEGEIIGMLHPFPEEMKSPKSLLRFKGILSNWWGGVRQ